MYNVLIFPQLFDLCLQLDQDILVRLSGCNSFDGAFAVINLINFFFKLPDALFQLLTLGDKLVAAQNSLEKRLCILKF